MLLRLGRSELLRKEAKKNKCGGQLLMRISVAPALMRLLYSSTRRQLSRSAQGNTKWFGARKLQLSRLAQRNSAMT